MTQLIDPTPPNVPSDTDLMAAIHQVLAASSEPLTVSKIRAQLPAGLRGMSPEELTEMLRRQVAANALHQYAPYRSQQDRFWDRSMPVHIAQLLSDALKDGPLPWSQLRRKLPAYALSQSQAVLDDQLAQGRLYKHPRGESRGGERFGLRPPDARDYLQQELSGVFHRLEQLGFNQTQVREAALEILHNEEWAPEPPAQRARPQPEGPSPAPTEGDPSPEAPLGQPPATMSTQLPSRGPEQTSS